MFMIMSFAISTERCKFSAIDKTITIEEFRYIFLDKPKRACEHFRHLRVYTMHTLFESLSNYFDYME